VRRQQPAAGLDGGGGVRAGVVDGRESERVSECTLLHVATMVSPQVGNDLSSG
jgi:hypothetical protein